jgi:hypothetical protein
MELYLLSGNISSFVPEFCFVPEFVPDIVSKIADDGTFVPDIGKAGGAMMGYQTGCRSHKSVHLV